MQITLAAIAPRRSRSKAAEAERLAVDYIERASHFVPTEAAWFQTEAALMGWLDRLASRAPATLVLLDSHGSALTSEEFAAALRKQRDSSVQHLVAAIGPADGWSAAARNRAQLIFSLGRITLPHQLARVVLAEQIYRALTILAGHPYHSGH